MLEEIHGIPQRIATLKAKLKARDGKKEYKENVLALKAEIERLEALSLSREALQQFVTEQANPPVASLDESGPEKSDDEVQS